MFKGQPKGLYALALANTGERFGYYTMLAIFMLFLQAKFGWEQAAASQLYAIFLAVVYFLPVVGGWIADRIGYGKCVVSGICVMFLGYLLLTMPTAANAFGIAMMIGALLLIALGTGLFKGNLQVMIGNLYADPKYAAKRDSAFSLFYMAINIGAMFAPFAATAITNRFLAKSGLVYKADIPALAHQLLGGAITPENTERLVSLQGQMPDAAITAMPQPEFCSYYIEHLSSAYHMGFAVACVSLVVSIAIYFACRSWFKHADVNAKQAAAANAPVVELTPKQTRERVVALCMVFAVVIFFWMAFNQNGQSLTWFARDYTQSMATGWTRAGFSMWILGLLAVSVYTLFGTFQAEKGSNRIFLGIITLALWAGSFSIYRAMPSTLEIQPQLFQQFNPFFVVALTPVSMAVFGALARKGKEPSSPRKIGMGMIVAALGFLILVICSFSLASPAELKAQGGVSSTLVSPNWLISTYLVLTFAELLLSPIGISFVTKVAPPKYKGMMMGLWFCVTAIGNYLTSVIARIWGTGMPLWMVWGVLVVLCLLSAVFIFSIMKRLEKATSGC